MKTQLNTKLFMVTCMLCFFVKTSYSQVEKFSCGPTYPQESYFDKAVYEKNRQEEINILRNGNMKKDIGDSTYIIPIVFHIIHEYGSENISDAQILDAVRILNEDYKKLNSDTINVSPSFESVIGNAEIEFRLAQIDPFGNCTNGIDRIYSQETNIGDDGSKLRPWPRSKYLNIWVVRTMRNGVAGYAYYPSATTQGFGAFFDGIIILSNYIGSIGSGNPTRARALTHEVGHYLGLAHTWGSTNEPGVACGDDGISDTPITRGWDFCATSGLDVCNPGIEENIQNFMEYSYCSHMFTKDQVAGMRAVLNLPTALRNNLWSESNLMATGVEQNSVNICAPIADFNPSSRRICQGSSVTLGDNSYNGQVDTWQWTIPGGTPSTSTSQNPTITFNSAGWHNVTLTVSNVSGSNTKSIQNAIYVSPSYDLYDGLQLENFESFNAFEIANVFGSEMVGFENEEIPAIILSGNTVNIANWELEENAGYSGTKSMRLDAYATNDKMVDEFMTPSFNLTFVNSPVLTFKYSAATMASSIEEITEVLKIYVSTNCGQTWQYRGQIDGLDLITAGFSGDYFKPNALSQWRSHSISLPASFKTSNVRFKFEYTSGDKSNNIFIDDIAIEGTLGIKNENGENTINLYPNPTTNFSDLVITYNAKEDDVLSLEFINSLGQVIFSKEDIKVSTGEKTLMIGEMSGIRPPAGIYFVKIISKQQLHSQRFVIK